MRQLRALKILTSVPEAEAIVFDHADIQRAAELEAVAEDRLLPE